MRNIEEKKQFVDSLVNDIGKSKGIYLAESSGISANAMNELRKKCHEGGSRYLTAKNRLVKRAFSKVGINSFEQTLKGPTSIILAFDDPVASAKVLAGFAKENKEKFTLKKCIVEGKTLEADDVSRLATIPSREVLLGKLLSVLNAPITNLAGVMSEVLRKVPAVIDAVAKKKSTEL